MGTGGHKAHEAITLSPASAFPTTDATAAALDQTELLDLVAQLGPDHYDDLVTLVNNSNDENFDPEALPVPLQNAVDAPLAELTDTFLNALTPAELQQLAANHGFSHPTLVGLSEADQSPLVHWLDPLAADTATKAKIQAKATERYQALQAGETIAGQDLASVQAAEAALGLKPPGVPYSWEATPTEAAFAMADLTSKAAELSTAPYSDKPPGLTALIVAENTLHTATCPELGPALDEMKAAGALLVSEKVASHWKPGGTVVVAAVHEAGLIDSASAQWLSPSEAVQAARLSSGSDQIDSLTTLASERAAKITELNGLKAAGYGSGSSFASIDSTTTEGQHALLNALAAANTVRSLSDQAVGWKATDSAGVTQATGGVATTWAVHNKFQALTTNFRAWAKTQKLSGLRSAATTAGLNHDSNGTRADIQNYLAGQFDPNIDQHAIQTKLTAKATNPTAHKTPPASSAVKASSKTAATTSSGSTSPSSGSPARAGHFAGKVDVLAAKLKAHTAIANDLPAATSPNVVTAHNWGSGTPWSKGSHESALHTGPGGQQWMFKPDKSNRGARAHAEAAASQVFQRVGVAGVDVHVVKIGGKVGAVQPLVKGAANLDSSPSSWAQPEVDSLVRLHVAAWAVGDHDGHANNVMRSPAGGVFAVDQGQAFKFFGRDKLDHTWKPNGNHGTAVYHAAYSAQQKGSLASGVAVRASAALPVIKAFEAIPDAQYRSMLAATATEGVKHNVHWVEPMRAAAKERLGTATVSDADIAEQFLHAAVDRKNRLRESFGAFFAGLGVADASHLAWVK